MSAKKIMVQGTMSGVGKSIITALLCRIFTEDGYSVSPFKSQNMALNSYVTRDNKEIGRAQAMQAFFSKKEPDFRMNPILLKPNSDTGSEVIINGEVIGSYRAADYFKKKKDLIPIIKEDFYSLSRENDIIVIEGAGSPAEINLKADDIVNMGLSKMLNAPVILVSDIDPGGVFAQIYGTIMLLNEEERDMINGIIINKFRGDKSLLTPGIRMIEDLVKKPVIGTLPFFKHNFFEEDSLSKGLLKNKKDKEKLIDAAVIRLPHISNFTDISPLEEDDLLSIRYVFNAKELLSPDLIIIPGTKNTIHDLKWLKESGLFNKIKEKKEIGSIVFGICGGFQILGKELYDEESGKEEGLSLLDIKTVFKSDDKKILKRVKGEGLKPFSGCCVTAYEIHKGRLKENNEKPLFKTISLDGEASFDGAFNKDMTVFGTYLHGVFDSGDIIKRLKEMILKRKGTYDIIINNNNDFSLNLEEDILKATKLFRENIDMDKIYGILR